MGKRIGAACVVGGCALVFGVASAAAGWAGSRYAQGDCSLSVNGGRPSLYCEARFTTITPNVSITFGVADETCTSGLRLFRRTGTRVSSFLGWDAYNGPVPLSRFNVGGNETDFQDTWRDLVETDLGCSG